MSYLPQFEFDVFLSYGWAGSEDASSGDPAWAKEFYRRLLDELRGNSRHVTVYYDREQPLSGDILKNLTDASSSSAIFVFISTPDSERDGSYCRDELRAFFAAEHKGTEPPADRTFVVKLRPFAPLPSPRPPEITGIGGYQFCSGPTPYPAQDLADANTTAGDAFAKLAGHIVNKLNSMRQTLRRHTTYVAATSRDQEAKEDRLRAEQQLAGRYVLCPSGAIGDERGFLDDCANRIDASGLCLHIADKEFLAVPPGWQKSRQRVQLIDLALPRSAAGSGPQVLVWIAPEALPLIDRTQFSTRWSDVVCNNTFEEFTSIAGSARKSEPQSPATSPKQFTKTLYIHCLKDEIRTLRPVREAARNKGLDIQWPYFDGTLRERQEMIRQAVRGSAGSLVYFGKDADINVGRARDLINAVFAESLPSAPRALLLDPGDDDFRLEYRAVHFEKIPHTSPVPPDLDAFLDRVAT